MKKIQATAIALGVLFGGTGLSALWLTLTGEVQGLTYFNIWYGLGTLSLVGLAFVLPGLFRNGWDRKQIQTAKRVLRVILALKVFSLFGLFFRPFTSLLSPVSLSLIILLGAIANTAIWKLWDHYHRRFILYGWGIFNLLFVVGLFFQNWYFAGEPSVFQIFSIPFNLFILSYGFIFWFKFRNMKDAPWASYLDMGDPEIPHRYQGVLSNNQLLKALNNHQLVIRANAAGELGHRDDPRAIEKISDLLREAPRVYWLEEESVAAGWKAVIREGTEALTRLRVKNLPYLKGFPHVYCLQCNKKAQKYSTIAGENWVMCPKCHQHKNLVTNVRQISGTLGLNKSHEVRGSRLYLNLWNAKEKQILTAEIDDLALVISGETFPYDWAASAFVQKFENDLRNAGKKISIEIDSGVELTDNTRNILRQIDAKFPVT